MSVDKDYAGNRPQALADRAGLRGWRARIWRARGLSLHIRTALVYVVADLSSIFFSFALIAGLRGSDGDANWLLVASLMASLFVAVAVNGDGYALSTVRDPFRAVARGVKAFVIALMVLLLAAYYLKASVSLPRLTIALGACCAILTMAALRYSIARNLDAIVGGNPYSVALIWEPGQLMPTSAFSVVITAVSLMDPEWHDPVM